MERFIALTLLALGLCIAAPGAAQNARPTKILMGSHIGEATITHLTGVNSDRAMVIFTRKYDDFVEECTRNVPCDKSGLLEPYPVCMKRRRNCISESSKIDKGILYSASAVCSTRTIVSDMLKGKGGRFRLASLKFSSGYPETDWLNLDTGALTGNCSACGTPHLVSALTVLCPEAAETPFPLAGADAPANAALELTPAPPAANLPAGAAPETEPSGAATAVAILALLICLFIYFLPFIVAVTSNRQNAGSIFIINLFLGWTLLFWVLTLAWAASTPGNRRQ